MGFLPSLVELGRLYELHERAAGQLEAKERRSRSGRTIECTISENRTLGAESHWACVGPLVWPFGAVCWPLWSHFGATFGPEQSKQCAPALRVAKWECWRPDNKCLRGLVGAKARAVWAVFSRFLSAFQRRFGAEPRRIGRRFCQRLGAGRVGRLSSRLLAGSS